MASAKHIKGKPAVYKQVLVTPAVEEQFVLTLSRDEAQGILALTGMCLFDGATGKVYSSLSDLMLGNRKYQVMTAEGNCAPVLRLDELTI